MGNPESWVDLAQDIATWNEFNAYFIDYVESQVLRQDTRSTLAKDARAIAEQQDNTATT